MPIIVIDTNKDLMETTVAAQQIGIGYATLYRWIKSGKILALKVGRRTLIPKSEIERLKLSPH